MPNWDPKQPYQELPLLPPDQDIESKAILRKCISARAALAELKRAAEQIPNPSILVNTLPLLEAKASSEIENIVTTTDKLFEHLKNDASADPATKEALRYSAALYEGFSVLKDHPINTRTAEAICSRIRNIDVRVRKVSGTALKNDQIGDVVYTPPVGEDLLRDLLKNWEIFIHQDDEIDPLIKMAVGHYQFEAIHPFTDGNGRTGRIINSLFLIEKDLLSLPVLYLSRYILQNRSTYNRLLLAVTEKAAWEEWILFMLTAVEESAAWTTNKISAIRNLAEHTRQYVKRSLPKIYSYELANIIFELPYCRISNLIDRGIAKRQTASTYLRRLVEVGVLVEYPSSKEKLFVNPKLMRLLTQESNSFEYYD